MSTASRAARSVAAGLRRGWWWMLAIALIALAGSTVVVAGPVEPDRHVATAPVLVGGEGTAPPDTAGMLAAMRSAAGTPAVRADIARRAGISDAGQAGIRVEPAGPARIDVLATAVEPAVATRVTGAARESLIAAVAADRTAVAAASVAALRGQLADADRSLAAARKGTTDQQVLQAQRDALVRSVAAAMAAAEPQLLPGDAPVAAPAPAAPPALPPWLPALVFLAVLAALAMAVPLGRAVRGLLPDGAPEEWSTRRLAVPVVLLSPRRSPALDLAELYRTRLRELPAVTVVQLTRPTACDLGGELVRSAALGGDDRTHDDRTPGSCRVPDGRTGGAAVRTLRTRWLDRDTAGALRDAGPTVLVVETATARRAGLVRDVSLLRGVGAEVVAVVLWSGRVPFDPARPWAPPDQETDGADRATVVPTQTELPPGPVPASRWRPSPVPR